MDAKQSPSEMSSSLCARGENKHSWIPERVRLQTSFSCESDSSPISGQEKEKGESSETRLLSLPSPLSGSPPIFLADVTDRKLTHDE